MHVNPKLSSLDQARAATPDADDKARLDAAKKFEGLLMQQLLHVMRSTAKSGGLGGSDGASGQYMSMFDEVIADKLAEGGGIGLANTLVEAMGGKGAEQTLPSREPGVGLPVPQGGLSPRRAPSEAAVSPPLPGLRGATSRLAQAAYALSAPEGGKQWAREGTLTTRDLASPLATATGDGGLARFSVSDAQGFRDKYKCNLFAFEAARRAGFEVPVVARSHGWGFPTSNTVTAEAQQGALRGNWAEVVEGPRIDELKHKLERGEVGLMLTGSGADGRAGHMAVVERIHHVALDAHGEVERIEFDGYEARVDGAQHLTRRTWNRHGNGEDGKQARNGFAAIELLALHAADATKSAEIKLSTRARASRSDDR